MSPATQVKAEFDPTVQRMVGVSAHRYLSFNVPYVTEIADNLWQGGCRNGLILPRFFKHLVSLYMVEQYKVKHELDSKFSIKAYDSVDQSTDQIDAVAAWVNTARQSGPVLVHCQAGLNRSGLVVARALMLNGMSSDAAIRLIRERRSPAVLCNPAFEGWLRSR